MVWGALTVLGFSFVCLGWFLVAAALAKGTSVGPGRLLQKIKSGDPVADFKERVNYVEQESPKNPCITYTLYPNELNTDLRNLYKGALCFVASLVVEVVGMTLFTIGFIGMVTMTRGV